MGLEIRIRERKTEKEKSNRQKRIGEGENREWEREMIRIERGETEEKGDTWYNMWDRLDRRYPQVCHQIMSKKILCKMKSFFSHPLST